MLTDVKIRLVIFVSVVAGCFLSWWFGRVGADREVRKLQNDVRDEHNGLLNEQIVSRKLSAALDEEQAASTELRREVDALRSAADRVAKQRGPRYGITTKAKRKVR